MEKKDQHKHPTKVFDVKEADISLVPELKKLNFVDELEKVQPVAKRIRTQKRPASKVLYNTVEVNKESIKLDDLFKVLVVAVPAVLCFILNAPVRMKPQQPSLNGLTMSDIIPELGGIETQGMTDAICNMKKSNF